MATETVMTTQEAIRALDGMSPYIPPGHVEKLRPVLLRVAQAEAEHEDLCRANEAERARGERDKAAADVETKRLQGILAELRSAQTRLDEAKQATLQEESRMNSVKSWREPVERLKEKVMELASRLT